MGRYRLLPAIAVIAAMSAGTSYALNVNYRYYKFTTTATLGGGNPIQMSEFRFVNGATTTNPTIVTLSPGLSANGGGEDPLKLLDNIFTTKWFNFGTAGKEALVFDYGAPSPAINGYTFRTAQAGGGESPRNPKSWTLEGSNTSATGPWTMLDIRQDYPTPTTAQTELPIFTIPDSIQPVIDTFQAAPIVVLGGASVSLNWATTFADTASIDQGIGSVGVDDFTEVVPPNPPASIYTDTTYTLTADSAIGDPVTKSVTVRAVDGGSFSYRYIRFTPVQTGSGDFQLADLRFFDEGVESVPVAVYNNNGTPATGDEGPQQIIDGNSGSKWFSGSLVPVIIDMGEPAEGEEPKAYDTYQFVLGGDAGGYPGRNPLRWKLEGSDTMESWALIEDFTSFSYPMPAINGGIVELPFPGIAITQPPNINGFYAERVFGETDEIAFTWDVSSAESVSINVPGGEDLGSFGFLSVPATAGATYTLSATNPGGTSTKQLIFGTLPAVPPTTVNYPNFNSAGEEFALLGDARIVNDFTQIPLPGNAARLRMVPDAGGRHGVSWFKQKLPINDSFDTTFQLQLSCLHRGYGAEGLGFMIQNTAEGVAAMPLDNGPASNALTIKFSSWDNVDGVLNEARVNVFSGATRIATADLRSLPVSLRGEDFATLTGAYTDTPYLVHITYVPGDLDISVDGVAVLSDVNVNLESIGAVDNTGSAYVGFVARTGGWDQASDIPSWTLASTGSPFSPLLITSGSFNATAGSGTLTWTSSPGSEYRITSSTNLGAWSTIIAQDIPATGASTTYPFTFTPAPGGKLFFRVEEE